MVNSSVLEHQLFAADKVVTQEAINWIGKAERAMNERSKYRNASSSDWRLRYFFPAKDLSATNFQWKLDQPSLVARAMTIAGDTLFVAGPPDLVDERQAYYNPDDPEVQDKLKRQTQAYEGQAGGQLWTLAKATGTVISRYVLSTIPVFDGMAAADNSLFMATVNGHVTCYAGNGKTSLRKVDDSMPVRNAWDKREDPDYLLPIDSGQATQHR
jgi:hypothetical protein